MTTEKVVRFHAGRGFTAEGQPAHWWKGEISYRWDCSRQKFYVSLMQILGTGTVENMTQYEYNLSSCDSVNTLIDSFKILETHYKKSYE